MFPSSIDFLDLNKAIDEFPTFNIRIRLLYIISILILAIQSLESIYFGLNSIPQVQKYIISPDNDNLTSFLVNTLLFALFLSLTILYALNIKYILRLNGKKVFIMYSWSFVAFIPIISSIFQTSINSMIIIISIFYLFIDIAFITIYIQIIRNNRTPKT